MFVCSVFKDADGLSQCVKSQLLPAKKKQTEQKSRREEEDEAQRRQEENNDPLRMPSRHPAQEPRPHWFVLLQTVFVNLTMTNFTAII